MSDQEAHNFTHDLLKKIQAELAGVRQEQARTNETVAAIGRTLRAIERDLTGLKDRVTILSVSVDDPLHPRLELDPCSFYRQSAVSGATG